MPYTTTDAAATSGEGVGVATTDGRWWIAASTPDDASRFAAWVYDRAAVHNRHVVPVTAVARDEDGRLLARLDPPAGTPLRETLDRIGTLTPGVAVTLGVPLLEVAASVDAGALLVGPVGADDVLVDDAGAVVVIDRPPGAEALGAEALGAGALGADAVGDDAPRTSASRAPVGDPVDALVIAARVVWDAVDAREPCRGDVDTALGLARDGGPAVTAALQAVRTAANPRPVPWDPPPALLDFTSPPAGAPASGDGIVPFVRVLVESGVHLPGGRRLGLRRAVVALAVVAGVVAASVVVLDAS